MRKYGETGKKDQKALLTHYKGQVKRSLVQEMVNLQGILILLKDRSHG